MHVARTTISLDCKSWQNTFKDSDVSKDLKVSSPSVSCSGKMTKL